MQITSQRIITEYCRVHFLVMTIVFNILNANKQIKDKENRPSVDVEMVNTTAVEKLVTNRTMPLCI